MNAVSMKATRVVNVSWWWLRSPGLYNNFAAAVIPVGYNSNIFTNIVKRSQIRKVDQLERNVVLKYIGVHSALWMKYVIDKQLLQFPCQLLHLY